MPSQSFTTAGSSTFTWPTGVTEVTVEVWGAGSTVVQGGETLQYRVWDKTTTIYIPADRLVTIRLGTGKRPAGYDPVPVAKQDDEE